MTEVDPEAAQALFEGHASTANTDMSALRISEPTANQVREIRDSLNAAAGTKVISNEDVVRLSLLTLGTLQQLSGDGPTEISEETADVIVPLMDHIRDAADPDVLRRHMDNPADSEGESE